MIECFSLRLIQSACQSFLFVSFFFVLFVVVVTIVGFFLIYDKMRCTDKTRIVVFTVIYHCRHDVAKKNAIMLIRMQVIYCRTTKFLCQMMFGRERRQTPVIQLEKEKYRQRERGRVCVCVCRPEWHTLMCVFQRHKQK